MNLRRTVHELSLTAQEECVLLYSLSGVADSNIAELMDVEVSTVRRYWSQICKKAGQSRTVLMARILRNASLNDPPDAGEPIDSFVSEVAARRIAELRFEAMADSSPFGIFAVDPSHNCTYVNSAFSKITGLTFEQATDNKWIELVHEEDRDAVTEAWRVACLEGGPFTCIYRLIRLDGVEIRIVVRANKLESEGHDLGYLGTVEDVSSQPELQDALAATNQQLAQIEQRLKATEVRFRIFMDQMPGIGFIKDSEGRLVYASKAFEETFGFPPSLVIGKKDVEYLPRSVAKRTRAIEHELLKKGGNESSVEIDHSVEGGRRWLVHRFAFNEGDKRMLGGTSFDVTSLWEAEEKFQACAEASVDSLILMKPVRKEKKVVDFTFDFFNPSARRFYGDRCERLVGKRMLDVFPNAHTKRMVTAYRKCLNTGTSFQMEVRSQMKTTIGRLLLVQAVKAGTSVAVCIRDLTDERALQRSLVEAEAQHRAALESLDQGVLLIDARGRIVAQNKAASEIVGCKGRDLRGISIFRTPWKVIDSFGRRVLRRDRPAFQALQGERVDSVEQIIRRPDGTKAWICISCNPIFLSSSTKPHMAVASFTDITHEVAQREKLFQNVLEISGLNFRLEHQKEELEEANRQLKVLATTDALTGLMNHGTFKQTLEEEMARARRYRRPLSVLLLDFDRFKAFNDSFGHLSGDEALKTVGRAIHDARRSSDIAARYGGEEFAILMPETSSRQAMILAERLRKTIEALDVPERKITVSIGLATLRNMLDGGSELLACADAALYEAKATGRNRVVRAGPSVLDQAFPFEKRRVARN